MIHSMRIQDLAYWRPTHGLQIARSWVLMPWIWRTGNQCCFIRRFTLADWKPQPAQASPLDRVYGDRVTREGHFSQSSYLTLSTKTSKMTMKQCRGGHFRAHINPIKHTSPPQTLWLLSRCCGAVAPRSNDCPCTSQHHHANEFVSFAVR